MMQWRRKTACAWKKKKKRECHMLPLEFFIYCQSTGPILQWCKYLKVAFGCCGKLFCLFVLFLIQEAVLPGWSWVKVVLYYPWKQTYVEVVALKGICTGIWGSICGSGLIHAVASYAEEDNQLLLKIKA